MHYKWYYEKHFKIVKDDPFLLRNVGTEFTHEAIRLLNGRVYGAIFFVYVNIEKRVHSLGNTIME